VVVYELKTGQWKLKTMLNARAARHLEIAPSYFVCFHFFALAANCARFANTPPSAFSLARSACVMLAPADLPVSLCIWFFLRLSFSGARAIIFSRDHSVRRHSSGMARSRCDPDEPSVGGNSTSWAQSYDDAKAKRIVRSSRESFDKPQAWLSVGVDSDTHRRSIALPQMGERNSLLMKTPAGLFQRLAARLPARRPGLNHETYAKRWCFQDALVATQPL
jgi:hypothetical protein